MKGAIKMAIRFLTMPIREKSTLESRKFGEKIITKKIQGKSLLEERIYCSEEKKVGIDCENKEHRKKD